MVAWVETQVPCMLYCGPDLCTCSAYYFYEELEEDEDWSIQDRKEHAVKRAYAKYLAKLQASPLNAYPDQVVAQLKEMSTFSESGTFTA